MLKQISTYKTVLFVLMLSLLWQIGCSSQDTRFTPPEPVPDDRLDVPRPESRDIPVYEDYFDRMTWERLDNVFDTARHFRSLTGQPKQAFNANAFDDVDDSSWFTNRNARTPLSLEEIKRGPNQGSGPAVDGKLTITRAKTQGVTPGFTVKDRQGDYYLLKFDPMGYPELASGAEVVSTKFFYAAGYNTPENYVAIFDPANLVLGDEVKFTDEKGRDRLMTEADIEAILQKIEKRPDGKIRALASKFLSGKLLGPFRYTGVRDDDLNDFIPHQHRREIRGLRVLAAWLNHFDTKDGNSLDIYVTEDERSFVKHYLIDFGATLGSASHSPNHKWRGFRYDADPWQMLTSAAKLGLFVEKWRQLQNVNYPSVGIFEAEQFHPHEYYPQVANPAFSNLTHRDGYWAAKIVMSFTDAQIEAAVEAGQYSNPEAAAYLVETLKKRRDKIGRYYFNRAIPLDHFRLEDGRLCFNDLAIDTGLESADATEYRYDLHLNDTALLLAMPIDGHLCIPLDIVSREELSADDQIRITLQLKRGDHDWSKWVKVYLKPVADSLKLFGLEREE